MEHQERGKQNGREKIQKKRKRRVKTDRQLMVQLSIGLTIVNSDAGDFNC